jgi:hypothetical protein
MRVSGMELRKEFLRLLTEGGSTEDRRRNGYNQPVFASEPDGGYAIWSNTSLDMVMDKFDKAVAEAELR